MKRLVVFAVAVIALVLPGSPAAAAERTVEQLNLPFTLSSDTCPNLPDETTVTGSAAGRSITTTRTDRNGVTTVINHTMLRGTATDQDGNTYRVVYVNSFRVDDAEEPGVLSGTMHDTFSLKGRGPAQLTNGFVARVAFLPTEAVYGPVIAEFGDPLDFATGRTECDPL